MKKNRIVTAAAPAKEQRTERAARGIGLIVTACILLLGAASCAVLTESQIKCVNSLTTKSDTVTHAPERIFEALAEVRRERGLYFAASLTSSEARYVEMNGLAAGAVEDAKSVKKSTLYADVLDSYLRALRSISSPARYEAYGTRLRGLGIKSDSLIAALNATGWITDIQGEVYDIPTGYAKLAGRAAGYLTENYERLRQARFVRSFVTEGDTLVAATCDALVDLLRGKELSSLYSNELEGLNSNYQAYLRRVEAAGVIPDISNDRNYVRLRGTLETARTTTERCIGALKSLKRAHHKLVGELDKRRDITYFNAETIELNSYCAELAELIKKLDDEKR